MISDHGGFRTDPATFRSRILMSDFTFQILSTTDSARERSARERGVGRGRGWHPGLTRRAVLWLIPLLALGCAGAPPPGPESAGPVPSAEPMPEPEPTQAEAWPTEERVVFYTTYAYLDQEAGEWVIPVRYWVHEGRETIERLAGRVAARFTELEPREQAIFQERARAFVADSESLERVEVAFPGDAEALRHRVLDRDGGAPRTGLNGVVEGEIRLSLERVDALLQAQGGDDGWLTWHAVSRDHHGVGRALLVEPQGVSVISDIDDTVRITGIPDGWATAVENTLFREFMEAPGMPELYREWAEEEGAIFHYVSGTPWQFYEPLRDFLFAEEVGYPRGSLHLRTVRTNLLSVRTWRDLFELTFSGANTPERKYAVIAEKLERFPQRRFRLVGDTGEGDPEIYRRLAEEFPEQVLEIVIRDVTGDRIHRPERLRGMTVIPADS